MKLEPEDSKLLGRLEQHAENTSEDLKEIKESFKELKEHIGTLYKKTGDAHSRLDAHDSSFKTAKWFIGIIVAAIASLFSFKD